MPPRFAVLDERRRRELLAEARGAHPRPRPPRAAPGRARRGARTVGRTRRATTLTGLIDGAVARPDRARSDPDGSRRRDRAACATALGLPARHDSDASGARCWRTASPRRMAGARGRAPRDRQARPTRAGRLARGGRCGGRRRRARWRPTGRCSSPSDGEPRGRRLPPRTSRPGSARRSSAEQERLVALASRLAAAETLERTEPLPLAGAVRAEAEAAEAPLGALDFADLIHRTLELLERGAAAWVLYKLDRGIDHVLVDEAQDTNPDQWQILRRLTEDFTAGRRPAAPRAPHGVRGRRPEAVDLLLPGRRPAPLRGRPAPLARAARQRRARASRTSASPCRSAPRPPS